MSLVKCVYCGGTELTERRKKKKGWWFYCPSDGWFLIPHEIPKGSKEKHPPRGTYMGDEPPEEGWTNDKVQYKSSV